MTKLASIVVLGLALMRPSAAAADTLNLVSLGRGETIQVQLGTGSSTTKESGFAGEINWLDGAQSLFSYCVDLFDNALNQQNNVTVGTTNELTSATDAYTQDNGAGGRAAYLFNTYADVIHSMTPGIVANDMAAGLQIAIWDTIYAPYDPLHPSTAGTFTILSASAGAMSFAEQILKAAGGQTSLAVYLNAASGAGQDQITRGVPEPSSILFSGLGVLCLVFLKRRALFATQQNEMPA